MPLLALDALRQRIKDGKLSRVHAFVGEDTVQIDRMVDALEATVDEADRPFAVERLYACDEGGEPVDIAAAARALPMLGERRIVIVLRAERFLKPKRAGKAAAETDEAAGDADEESAALDLAPLEDYLAAPVESTTLVFVASAVDRGRRFYKRLQAGADITVFEGLAADRASDRRQMQIVAAERVKEELRLAGRTIDSAGVRLLVERAGGDISRLRGDLERLLLFTEGRAAIAADDVAEIVSADVPVEDDWAVTNALSAGDAGRALAEVGHRLDRGDSPHMLLGQLRWWVSSKLAEAEPARAKPALDALLRTDLALKSSGGDRRVLLERLVVELTGRPLPQGGWRR